MNIYNSFAIRTTVSMDLPSAKIQIPDANYALPNVDWVSGKLHFDLFSNWIWENNLSKWKSYWDCDNFSILFYNFAHICHARTMKLRESRGEETAQGIGIGIVFFKQKSGGGHAINFVITPNGLKFLEPQNGKYINLTNEEKDSAWFAMV